MAKFKVRVVNRGLLGEPHHYCFQSTENNKIIEFSQITQIVNQDDVIQVQIEDSDISNIYISDVLNEYGQMADLRYTGDGYEIIF